MKHLGTLNYLTSYFGTGFSLCIHIMKIYNLPAPRISEFMRLIYTQIYIYKSLSQYKSTIYIQFVYVCITQRERERVKKGEKMSANLKRFISAENKSFLPFNVSVCNMSHIKNEQNIQHTVYAHD